MDDLITFVDESRMRHLSSFTQLKISMRFLNAQSHE
jgi:hypothetical protein